jgi:hypothetical protein
MQSSEFIYWWLQCKIKLISVFEIFFRHKNVVFELCKFLNLVCLKIISDVSWLRTTFVIPFNSLKNKRLWKSFSVLKFVFHE